MMNKATGTIHFGRGTLALLPLEGPGLRIQQVETAREPNQVFESVESPPDLIRDAWVDLWFENEAGLDALEAELARVRERLRAASESQR